jgi:hypothetical protein
VLLQMLINKYTQFAVGLKPETDPKRGSARSMAEADSMGLTAWAGQVGPKLAKRRSVSFFYCIYI